MHLASEACRDTGRPGISRRALGQMPKVEQARTAPTTSPSTAWKSTPSSCHHGVEVRTPPFVNIFPFFI